MAEPTHAAEAKTETSPEVVSSTTEATAQKPPETAIEDDSDPDFDDLDDVLDQFSSAKATNQQVQPPAPSSSGPGRPALSPEISIPSGQQPNESEEAFMARLTAEMSSVMSKMSADPAANAATPEDIAKMGRELEEFTQKMEAEGIQPEDLLKAILGEDVGGRVGDIAHEEKQRRESESKSRTRSTGEKEKEKEKEKSGSPETSRAALPSEDRPTSSSSKTKQASSFEDTIARTMAKLSESSAHATSQTQQTTSQKSEEALLADLLRGLDASGEGEDDGDLSKMFLGMMEQLTNKEMLYEPMKELSTKFPEWLAENDPSSATSQATSTSGKKSKSSKSKSKPSQEDFERFTRQERIVQDIVRKFETPQYSDDDPKCREYIWEKMQEMQGEGAPPEELIANPFPGMGMGMPGGAGGEEGCPTQ
ncbi:Peroxisome chaperone and import receptor [Cladophialophora chaetospira]|uniref:Peroxisome chaperone and import receptor n=1 Tax=Cladophialophora chaetospira TaxID=386627 RepID=A0AA39CGS1_9EURO|nr:Peroxisome chaperone and import receptor [Cladophialophora chaetospira]